MTAFALLFTLSAIGMSETAYLIRKWIAAEQPLCPFGEQCTVVLTSKYNKLFIIPNDVLGLLFYTFICLVAALLVIGVGPLLFWKRIFQLAVAVGMLLSLYFTYLQWRVIRAWCFWCLMSALTVWLMGLIILTSSSL
jgi:uncharacterized membrane protein